MDSTITSASCRTAATEARRQAIMQAALTLFLSKGFTDTTMEDIRQLSGASTGSIYHHFANKDMLALAIYREGRDRLNTSLLTSLETDQPRDGIRALVYAYLTWFIEQPETGRYIIQAANTEYLGEQVAVLRRSQDVFAERFIAWLQPFIADGTIVRYPTDMYVSLVLGPSREFLRRMLQGRARTPLEEVREPLAQAAWRALANHPAS